MLNAILLYKNEIFNCAKRYVKGYGKKLFDAAKKSATVAVKTASKGAIQKTAEATADLVGNKIADKITIY